MGKKLVVGPDQMLDWLKKKKRIMGEIEDQLIRGLEGSGKGLTLEQLQAVVEHRNPFETVVPSGNERRALRDFYYFIAGWSIANWRCFYQDLGIKPDFSGLKIPKKREGFGRLIIIPKGLTIQGMYEVCKGLFSCWKYTNCNLDEVVLFNDRDPKNGSYAIWVRDRVEADEELKNLSVNDLKARGIKGITLLERLIYEAKYFKETGKHLDVVSCTLCAGSRDGDGWAPFVSWGSCDSGLWIDYCFADAAYSNLRSREVVF